MGKLNGWDRTRKEPQERVSTNKSKVDKQQKKRGGVGHTIG